MFVNIWTGFNIKHIGLDGTNRTLVKSNRAGSRPKNKSYKSNRIELSRSFGSNWVGKIFKNISLDRVGQFFKGPNWFLITTYRYHLNPLYLHSRYLYVPTILIYFYIIIILLCILMFVMIKMYWILLKVYFCSFFRSQINKQNY